jgi:anti-anti-sigma regulatory factor
MSATPANYSHDRSAPAETVSRRHSEAMIRETEAYLDEHLDGDVAWPRRWEAPSHSHTAGREPAAGSHSGHARQVKPVRQPPDAALLVEIRANEAGQVYGERLRAIRKQLAAARCDGQQRDVVIDVSQVPSLNGLLLWTLLWFAWQLRLRRRDVVLFGVDPANAPGMALMIFPGVIYYRLKPGEALHFLDQRLGWPSNSQADATRGLAATRVAAERAADCPYTVAASSP